MVTEDRLIWENQGSVFYSSIKPFLLLAGPYVNSIQVVRKGAII